MEDLNLVLLARKSVHGVFVLISRQFLLNLVSFGTSLIIFTYLSTADIGVYVAVIAMQRVISFFTDFGLGAALVQKKEKIEQQELNTFFTLQVVISVSAFLIVFLLRSFLSSFFHLDESAFWLLFVLVFSIFLSSFKIIPSILLERTINFQKLVVPQIIESLVFNGILVILVLQGYKLSSYTWAFLISGIASIPFYYAVAPWKVSFGIQKESLKHLQYGVAYQAKNILATAKDDLLTVFLAKVLTFSELSYIGFGQRFAFFAFRYVVDSVTKVTFSTYARMQGNVDFLQKSIERSLFFVGAIMFPLVMGLVVTAPYIIAAIPRWQHKWEPALISLTFFCLNAIVSSLSNILVNVLDATGRSKTTLQLMILWTILTWVFTPIFIHFLGYNGVSIVSFLITLTIVYTIYLVKKIVPFHFTRSIYKPFFSSLVMSVVVYFGLQIFAKDVLGLSSIILCGSIFYFICMYAWAKHELKKDMQIIFAKI